MIDGVRFVDQKFWFMNWVWENKLSRECKTTTIFCCRDWIGVIRVNLNKFHSCRMYMVKIGKILTKAPISTTEFTRNWCAEKYRYVGVCTKNAWCTMKRLWCVEIKSVWLRALKFGIVWCKVVIREKHWRVGPHTKIWHYAVQSGNVQKILVCRSTHLNLGLREKYWRMGLHT